MHESDIVEWTNACHSILCNRKPQKCILIALNCWFAIPRHISIKTLNIFLYIFEIWSIFDWLKCSRLNWIFDERNIHILISKPIRNWNKKRRIQVHNGYLWYFHFFIIRKKRPQKTFKNFSFTLGMNTFYIYFKMLSIKII